MASALFPPEGATVEHAGFVYAALDGTHPDAPYADSDWENGLQVPSGWEVVPHFIKRDILDEVVAKRSWGTYWMSLAPRKAMGTRLALEKGGYAWQDASGHDKQPDGSLTNFSDQFRILIRKQVDPTAKSPPDARYVKEQIEYYLSDENLTFDNFFHEKISSNDQGWLDIDLILACAKMKALGATKRDIVQALTDSASVEANDDCSAIRRSDNKPLPTLRKRGRRGEGQGKGRGKGKHASKGGCKGNGYKKETEKRPKPGDDEIDPKGLFTAVKEALQHIIDKGWTITRGDSQSHEDYNENVTPKLFCRKMAPHANIQDLCVALHKYRPGPATGSGDERESSDCKNFCVSSYEEDELFSWFNCDAEAQENIEDDDDDDDWPTFDQWKGYAKKVQSLFDQHGVEKFSYAIEHEEGLVTTDGIGVVTASGYAIGFEASPVYWDP